MKRLNLYTKKEKDDLIDRLIPILSSSLKSLKNKYTYKEISTLMEIPQNRISDLVSERYLNEGILMQFLGGEIVTVNEIKKKVKLSKSDEEYLHRLASIANPILIKKFVKIQMAGGNLNKIADEWLKNNR